MIVPLNEYDFLKRAVVAHSSKEGVVCGSTRLTYGQFAERVYRWANLMRSLGVKKGETGGDTFAELPSRARSLLRHAD